MKFEFDHWRVKLILQALKELDEKWQTTMDNSEDEDVKAGYANDLLLVGKLCEEFERAAIEEFGPNIMNFSREPIKIPPDQIKNQ